MNPEWCCPPLRSVSFPLLQRFHYQHAPFPFQFLNLTVCRFDSLSIYHRQARLSVERSYLAHRDLSAIETGWKANKDFMPYVKALNGIPRKGDVTLAGQEFFERVPVVLFSTFRQMFEKHIGEIWRTNQMLHYIIGGSLHLACYFLRWVFGIRTSFPDEDVIIEHHTETPESDPVKVNIWQCLSYLTENADRDIVFDGPFIQENIDLLQKMAEADSIINLFDKATWCGINYLPLRLNVMKEIAIHPIHQQRCENAVQTAALVSHTKVSEARQSCRAMSLSLMRDFHLDELSRSQSKEKDPEKRRRIRYIEGAYRIRQFSKFQDEFTMKVKRARKAVGKEKCQELFETLESTSSCISAVERAKSIRQMQVDANFKRKIHKAERNDCIDITAQMGGRVELSKLTAANKQELVIVKELIPRGCNEQEEQLKKLGITELKSRLKEDEAGRLAREGQAKEGIDPKNN